MRQIENRKYYNDIQAAFTSEQSTAEFDHIPVPRQNLESLILDSIVRGLSNIVMTCIATDYQSQNIKAGETRYLQTLSDVIDKVEPITIAVKAYEQLPVVLVSPARRSSLIESEDDELGFDLFGY